MTAPARHRPETGAPPPLARVAPPWRLRARSTLWRVRHVVAAVCVGLAAGVVVHALRPPPPVTVGVVVLGSDVAAGTALTAEHLLVAHVPPQMAPPGAITDVAGALGRVAALDLPARLPVTASLLADAALTGPPGTAVVAVRLDDPAVAGLLEPGMRVDLVAAYVEGGTGETVAHRALVRPAPRADAAPAGLLGGVPDGDDAPVLVAVTPDEAVRLAQAAVSAHLVAVVVP